MTFALTSFFADGVRFTGPGPYRATQRYVFTATAAATDVDFDLGDSTGTFWTAAQADATYGTMAAQALDFIEAGVSGIQNMSSLFTPQIAGYALVRSLSATGTYTLSINSTLQLPDYTFHTAGGTTAYTVCVDSLLEPNIPPRNVSYNIG